MTELPIPDFRLWFSMEATGGFEPPNKGFADLSLNHLGTSPVKVGFYQTA